MQKRFMVALLTLVLGCLAPIVAGLGGVAGFVAEQVPFQSESSERSTV